MQIDIDRRRKASELRHKLPFLLLLLMLLAHVAGVARDYMTAIGSPIQIDYGEGLVWQQAVFIPGPGMYGSSQNLPFTVFNYPPLYYLLVHAIAPVMPTLLAAGRAVSVLATICISLCIGGLVRLSRFDTSSRYHQGLLPACIAGLLFPCLHAAHIWGMVMRVDTTAVALGLAGVCVAARGHGGFGSAVLGLSLCAAAVFTKQTQGSAGVAVFLTLLTCRPRVALLAGFIVGSVSLALLAFLQWQTQGGLLLNIVGYNINTLSIKNFEMAIGDERASWLVAASILIAVVTVAAKLFQSRGSAETRAGFTRRVLLLHLACSTLTLVTLFKTGGGFNYLLEWLAVGCAILGVAFADKENRSQTSGESLGLLALILPVLVTLIFLPATFVDGLRDPRIMADHDRLVARIARSSKPVASDDMTLLMEAGKRVYFEPAMVTELARIGRWNEAPLIDMIKARGFAFVIEANLPAIEATRRTPAVAAAIALFYKRVEEPLPGLRVRLPNE